MTLCKLSISRTKNKNKLFVYSKLKSNLGTSFCAINNMQKTCALTDWDIPRVV